MATAMADFCVYGSICNGLAGVAFFCRFWHAKNCGLAPAPAGCHAHLRARASSPHACLLRARPCRLCAPAARNAGAGELQTLLARQAGPAPRARLPGVACAPPHWAVDQGRRRRKKKETAWSPPAILYLLPVAWHPPSPPCVLLSSGEEAEHFFGGRRPDCTPTPLFRITWHLPPSLSASPFHASHPSQLLSLGARSSPKQLPSEHHSDKLLTLPRRGAYRMQHFRTATITALAITAPVVRAQADNWATPQCCDAHRRLATSTPLV